MFLKRFHGITISLRTLKRRLVDHRPNKIGSDISDASLLVITEEKSVAIANIWNKFHVTYGKVPRDKVMEV